MQMTLNSVLESVEPLIEAGAALHWLRPRKKSPVASDWSEKPRATLDQLRRTHVRNANIGIRLGEPSETVAGYIHLIDLDIRDPEKAREAIERLREIWPDFTLFPAVISGSGGESRHFYFITSKPFRSKKLARSPGFQMVWDKDKGRKVKKHDWEIELFGTGKQAVLPPSVHPDTGEPYRWITEPDLSGLLLGEGPILDATVVEGWGVRVDDRTGEADDPDDLMGIVVQEPLGLERDEIERILADLPDWWVSDRDTWYQVGMALHHEFRGNREGFDLWCEWSQEDPEKFNEDDQHRVWKSFKGNKRPVRMPTLIQAAKQNRFERESLDLVPVDDFAGETKVDDFEDLLDGEPVKQGEVEVSSEDDQLAVLGKPSEILSWESKLDLNDESQPKSTLPNVRLIVENDPRLSGCAAFNDFSKKLVFTQPPRVVKPRREGPKGHFQFHGPIWQVDDTTNGREVQDEHFHSMRLWLETPRRQGGWGLRVTDRDLKSAFINVCHEKTIHPLRDKLKRFHANWDGAFGRLETMFIRYLGCPDTPYHRQTARLLGIAAIARAMEPGCKWDFMPILEGGQGKRKSALIREMGIGYAGELDFDYRDKKAMIESCLGRWFMEFPELVGFNKAESEHMKRHITSTSDDYRVPYATFQSRIPRSYLFVGSTNDNTYLRDPTGNRRYWPIKVRTEGEIDTDAFAEEWPLMLGEAFQLYMNLRAEKPDGDLPLYLTDPEAQEEAKLLQEGARVQSSAEVLAGQLQQWLDSPMHAEFEEMDDQEPRYRDRVSVSIIWTEFMGQESRRSIPATDVAAITAALRHVEGWEPRPGIHFEDGTRGRGWVRTEDFKFRPKKRKLVPGKYQQQDDDPLDLLG